MVETEKQHDGTWAAWGPPPRQGCFWGAWDERLFLALVITCHFGEKDCGGHKLTRSQALTRHADSSGFLTG